MKEEVLKLNNKSEEIHAKGFNMISTDLAEGRPQMDFSKIRIGAKSLDDAVVSLGELKNLN